MIEALERRRILPEPELPDAAELIAEGLRLGKRLTPGRSAFLAHHGIDSEADYKRRCMAEGRVMFHAHIGFREIAQTTRACAEIYEALDRRGYRVDRFGMCFDPNMGYPPALRRDMPKSTGLIVETQDDWQALTAASPAAPHFGDFMIGLPASVENASAAIEAGATTIGNLAHFYNYRLLHLDDEVQRAAATIKAIALVAAQPREINVTSNVDDGFGSLFVDVACSLGMVLIEQHIVETLIGARHVTVFGNTFANPFNRVVFQRALGRISDRPGPMVYGSTTRYHTDYNVNRATLANYLAFDIAAQRLAPTGHAVTAIPVTEYERIPDTDEIIEVQIFANRLAELTDEVLPLLDEEAVEAAAERLVEGGRRFKEKAFHALVEAGIDTDNPLELLLALRRIGAKGLEERFGPGAPDEDVIRGRKPVLMADTMHGLEASARACLADLDDETERCIRNHEFVACVATTDVHEYGKILVERVLSGLDVALVDGGVSADPDDVARAAQSGEADFIALSTYNGIALTYLSALRGEMERVGLDIPVFVGGRINQILEGSNAGLPVDVSTKLEDLGASVCGDVRGMLDQLASMAEADRR